MNQENDIVFKISSTVVGTKTKLLDSRWICKSTGNDILEFSRIPYTVSDDNVDGIKQLDTLF